MIRNSLTVSWPGVTFCRPPFLREEYYRLKTARSTIVTKSDHIMVSEMTTYSTKLIGRICTEATSKHTLRYQWRNEFHRDISICAFEKSYSPLTTSRSRYQIVDLLRRERIQIAALLCLIFVPLLSLSFPCLSSCPSLSSLCQPQALPAG
jgi:hypothetical protein